jgi:hypothetical protein
VSRRVVGFIAAGIGAVIVFIAAAADVIGISSGGSAEMFGTRQIIGSSVGAAIVIAGLLFALLPRRR